MLPTWVYFCYYLSLVLKLIVHRVSALSEKGYQLIFFYERIVSKIGLQVLFDHFPFSMVKCVWNFQFSLEERKLPVAVLKYL